MLKLTFWALQTQVSQFALEFVKTRELEERLETAESNLVALAKAHTAAQDQLLALSSQSSMPYQARHDPCQSVLSCMCLMYLNPVYAASSLTAGQARTASRWPVSMDRRLEVLRVRILLVV